MFQIDSWNILLGKNSIIVKVQVFFTVWNSLMQRVNDQSCERKNSNWLLSLITTHQGEYEEALGSGHIPAWSHKNTQG